MPPPYIDLIVLHYKIINLIIISIINNNKIIKIIITAMNEEVLNLGLWDF